MRNVDTGSDCPLGKVDHPEPGEMVDDPVHVTAYGTGFEAVVDARSLDDGTELALGGLRSGEGMGAIFEASVVRRDG